jgi:hypothetical protein
MVLENPGKFMAEERIRQTNIHDGAVVFAVKDQVSTSLEEEAVILNLKDGVYYGLNPVGARIWDLLQEPRTVREILNILLEEYEVEPQRCGQDLLNLLKELAAKKLIEVKDAQAA